MISAEHKRLVWLALRLLGTAAGFTFVVWITDLREVGATLLKIPVGNLAVGLAMSTLTLLAVAARWWTLLRTYGAPRMPSFWRLAHLHLVGLFYNTYLPGGVGGDVVRAVVSREAFGEEGVTPALTVVLLERVVGLAALMMLVAGALAVKPLPGVDNPLPYCVAGMLAAAGMVLGLALVRRLAGVLPGRLGHMAARLPTMHWRGGLFVALLASILAQLIFAVAGHAMLLAVAPTVTLADSIVVVLVALIAAFFPLTVGGAGVREAAFVVLCAATLGISKNDSAAASLALWFCQLVVAGVGGLAQLFFPVRGDQGGAEPGTRNKEPGTRN